MSTVELHRRSLAVAGEVITRATDLDRPTPCAGWDLRALLRHMVGQNHGFADAVRSGDAPTSAYAPRPADGWAGSVEVLVHAFEEADPTRPVRLVEISGRHRFTVEQAAGFQLLDTVVHTWDVATAIGEEFRPDDDLLAATRSVARLVPTGAARTLPGAAFAEPRTPPTDDEWRTTLALLGRA